MGTGAENRSPRRGMCALVALALTPGLASAYFNNATWSRTATDGSVSAGQAITLTWGIADDGTTVPNVLPGVNRSSDLIESLDGWYGAGDGGADLTSRPWFGYLESAFDAWADVSGLRFIYEPADDGAVHGVSAGVMGTRADIRLAGGRYDGTIGLNTGTLAYSIAPDNADIFFDTDDVAYYSNPSGEAFGLRHTLMHEIGHSLGLGHVTSSGANILLEPFPQTTFDGPQLDDIRGVQWVYGDPDEALGPGYVRDLGVLGVGESAVVGADGEMLDFTPGENDLVSIHRSSDVDLYEFAVATPARITATLTPVGPTYDQRIGTGPATNILAHRVGDLEFEVRRNGALVAALDEGGFGDGESLTLVATPGDDFTLEVSGLVGATQLYRIDVAAAPLGLEGDFNGDGVVDAADYTRWRDGGPADANDDGFVDLRDYQVWSATFGNAASAFVAAPEPNACFAALLCALLAGVMRFRESPGSCRMARLGQRRRAGGPRLE